MDEIHRGTVLLSIQSHVQNTSALWLLKHLEHMSVYDHALGNSFFQQCESHKLTTRVSDPLSTKVVLIFPANKVSIGPLEPTQE